MDAITGALSGSQTVEDELSLQDRLLYLTKCLVGQHVEVQMKDGSIYSGIFHAANSKEDFGMFSFSFISRGHVHSLVL